MPLDVNSSGISLPIGVLNQPDIVFEGMQGTFTVA